MLGLLELVSDDGCRSQRKIAAELGIAVGLVNVYLSKCIRKGWVKARQVPARRYFYYLTPQGFAEKSNLTIQYLSSSFGFFRNAKAACQDVFLEMHGRGFRRLVLAGLSDLAEIAVVCASDCGVEIVALVDPAGGKFLSCPVVKSFDVLDVPFDAIVITDLTNSSCTRDLAIQFSGEGRVMVPELLRLGILSKAMQPEGLK